jgi:hypothetical protein
MKVIQSGNNVRILDEHTELYERLQPRSYVIRFNELSGFYLEEYHIDPITEKLYGKIPNKAEKVISTFKDFSRSLGIILSGPKGIGKSSFAKMIAHKAMENGYPVIVVDKKIANIHSFIEEITQEVCVLFDEFEKVFAIKDDRRNDPDNSQTALLSLFDGISPGKKMYIVTCNDIGDMDDYLINRPGRFHYHFRFDFPSPYEIDEYMRKYLKEEYHYQIDNIIVFSEKVKLNYDCLRSIVYELNKGDKFTDIIDDLNIINVKDSRFDIKMELSDGSILTDSDNYIDFFSSKMSFYNSFNESGTYCYDSKYMVGFKPSDYELNRDTREFIIPGDKVKLIDNRNRNSEKNTIDGIHVVQLIITTARSHSYKFYSY